MRARRSIGAGARGRAAKPRLKEAKNRPRGERQDWLLVVWAGTTHGKRRGIRRTVRDI